MDFVSVLREIHPEISKPAFSQNEVQRFGIMNPIAKSQVIVLSIV